MFFELGFEVLKLVNIYGSGECCFVSVKRFQV